jgi:NAD(P)-dependent dehydrogenase (short-subunit alcohol dehydrogenase family)
MIATGFVSGGATVYITSRTTKICDETAKFLSGKGPGKCISIPADLSKTAECRRLVDEISKREKHLDVLVNNAGANWAAQIDDYPEDAFEKVLNLNLKKIFVLTQMCIPLLTAKANQENPSSVINIGSIDGIRTPLPAGSVATAHQTFAYSSSKAGLHMLTKHMAGHLGPRGILVNCIAPGAFQSKMMHETLDKFGGAIISKIPVGRIGTPEDIAGTCLYLSSRAGHFTVGSVIVVDGGSMVNAKI